MRFKGIKSWVVAMGTLALAMAAGGAAAGPSVGSNLFGGELNLLSDNNAEYLVKGFDQQGAPNAGGSAHCLFMGANIGSSCVEVGDYFRGILQINSIEGLDSGLSNNIGSGTANNELAGLFEFEVQSVTNVMLGPAGNVRADISFIPSTRVGWTGTEVPGYLGAILLPAGTNPAVLLFEDTTPDFRRTLPGGTTDDGLLPDTGTITENDLPGSGGPTAGVNEAEEGTGPFASPPLAAPTGTASAVDGILRMVLGTGLDPDEIIIADQLPVDILVAQTTAAGTSAGDTNVQLSFLFNNLFAWNQVAAGIATGQLGADGFIDVNGTQSALGTGNANTAYDIFSNTDFTVYPIPEPGSLALLGLGLLLVSGLGMYGAKSRR